MFNERKLAHIVYKACTVEERGRLASTNNYHELCITKLSSIEDTLPFSKPAHRRFNFQADPSNKIKSQYSIFGFYGQSEPNEIHWLENTREIADSLVNELGDERIASIYGNSKIPFIALFRSMLAYCLTRLEEESDCQIEQYFNSNGVSDLIDQLAHSINDLASLAIYKHFLKFRNTLAEHLEGDKNSNAQNIGFKKFIEYMRISGWYELLLSKPVLLRLLTTVANNWIISSSLLIKRLAEDQTIIAESFFEQGELPPIASIQADISDSHSGGAKVAIINFKDLGKIVYKPKSLATDRKWEIFIDWLNRNNPPTSLLVANVVDRHKYGWCEYMFEKECVNYKEIERYYQRLGAWLAIFHATCSSDIHEENVISFGENPVPIDFETTFLPTTPNIFNHLNICASSKLTGDRIENSVINTGMLPTYIQGENKTPISIGSLRRSEFRDVNFIHWSNSNTMSMMPKKEVKRELSKSNLPFLDGAEVFNPSLKNILVQSMENYFAFLKEKVSEEDFPLNDLSSLQIRKVLRPTQFYSQLSRRLKDSRTWGDGEGWNKQLCVIDKIPLLKDDLSNKDFIISYEKNLLQQLNIPYFLYCSPILGSNKNFEALKDTQFMATGVARSKARIMSLNRQEIALQSYFAHISLKANYAKVIETKRMQLKKIYTIDTAYKPKEKNILINQLVSNTNKIAEILSTTAWQADGCASWIGMTPESRVSKSILGTLGSDLYSGNIGISLFLSAKFYVTNDKDAKSLAVNSIRPIRKILDSSLKDHYLRINGIGGVSGIGGLIYGLTNISTFLDDEDLLSTASSLAIESIPELLKNDKQFDISTGSAGAILALLCAFRRTHDTRILNIAKLCGDHILENYQSLQKVKMGSFRIDNKSIFGFSHGLAGIGYSLNMLGSTTNDERYLALSRLCVQVEHESFSHNISNWPDNRTNKTKGKLSTPCRWCHGAGGIGFSRLGINALTIPEEIISIDLERAIESVSNRGQLDCDSLCCGNFGNIEFLWEVGKSRNQKLLVRKAIAATTILLDEAEKYGGFRWPVGTDKENLGLFNGISGIGYSLLRKLPNNNLPNVLLFQ